MKVKKNVRSGHGSCDRDMMAFWYSTLLSILHSVCKGISVLNGVYTFCFRPAASTRSSTLKPKIVAGPLPSRLTARFPFEVAGGGFHPLRALPIQLDCGTNRQELLDNESADWRPGGGRRGQEHWGDTC